MKKLTVFVALALLAVAGTGYAVTCAYDNVPAATLLIPYFRVGGAIDAAGKIDTSAGTDTKISFVNVSDPGLIAHVTVWNKYSKAVLDFNVPMTGKDVVSFSMKDVLNGKLNVNPKIQDPTKKDVCGINLTTGVYNATPYLGWEQTDYLRMPHPQSGDPTALDWQISVSIYQEPDAFAPFRAFVLGSLDQSSDLTDLQSSAATGVVDTDNQQCGKGTSSLSTLAPEFAGYVTVDVVNYCTNFFPDQAEFYDWDAIATAGWGVAGFTPNALIGDVFYVDQTANTGNISGDPAVALEFDDRLNWVDPLVPQKTFFGRYVALVASACEETGGCDNLPAGYTQFEFGGDGREPLGDRYGFRYLSDSANGLITWIEVWRGDVYNNRTTGPTPNLCQWLVDINATHDGSGYGLYDTNHQLVTFTYDNDEGSFTIVSCPPGYPSPCPPGGTPSPNWIMLEATRVQIAGNTQINPGGYVGGWIDMQLRAITYSSIYNQAWLGVQHTGPGTLLNVGYSATNLDEQFQCSPAIFLDPGNEVVPPNLPRGAKAPRLK